MSYINVYLSIPPPFTEDEYPEFQGVKIGLFNDIAGKVIFDVIITEEDLDSLLTRVPQITVMDAWQDTGLRVGLSLDKTDPENPVITGSHTHTPNPSMTSGLKDKINYDANGNQVGATPRVFADDDSHRFAGWAKKDTVN